MSTPRCSIVIPTFRRPEATVRAVRSALAQTISGIEVIVVDDASGDGTPEAVEEIGDSRVKVLRQVKNQGACAARNRGVAEAAGPFIALLDSDDELTPDSVERRLAWLEARPECPMVFTRRHYWIAKDLKLLVPERSFRPEAPLAESLFIDKVLTTSVMLGRAEALRACPFDPDLPRYQEDDVALKLGRLGPLGFMEEPLTIIHAESEDPAKAGRITFNFDPERAHRIIEIHRAAFDESPPAEAALLYRFAMRALRIGRAKLAKDYLDRAIRLNPGHRKARIIRMALGLGLLKPLPALLEMRWWLLRRLGRMPKE